MTLLRDQRGAIMLLGLFMAAFLSGCLYYLMGIGEAIVQRERMQDAADGAAFGAAVLHARGMNLLVLINMTMAALLAILVALKLVETLVVILIFAIGMASFLLPGLGATIANLNVIRGRVRSAHAQAERVIHPTLRALNATSRAVRVTIPWTTQARVIEQSRTNFDDSVFAAVAIPTRLTLPVEDDSFGELCVHAGDYVGRLAALPFDAMDAAILRDALHGGIAQLTKAAPSWFCGDGSAPKARVQERRGYPRIEARERCIALATATPYDAGAHEDACAEADAQEQAAAVDETTGECLHDCEPGGAYDVRDARARLQCDPDEHHERRHYVWQHRQVVYEVAAEADHVRRTVLHERLDLRKSKRAPCGRGEFSTEDTWHVQQYDEHGVLLPVCSVGEPFPAHLQPGESVTVRRTEVLRVFGCEQTHERKLDVDEQAQPTDDAKERMAPQKLIEGAAMGSEAFQLRSLALGELPRQAPQAALAVAAFGRAPQRTPALSAARELGRAALAQAEYYFAGTPGNELWAMRWQARLRRLRKPEPVRQPHDDAPGAPGTTATTFELACESLDLDASSCAGAAGDGLFELAIH